MAPPIQLNGKMAMLIKHFALCVVAVIFGTQVLSAQTINFASDDTLKAVFASGLKPWRYDGSLDRCEISSEKITLLLLGGRNVTFPVESGSFRAFGNYELTESDFTTGLISVADAAELTKQIASELGISTDGIDSLAAQANPTSIPSPRFWSGKVSSGKFTVSVQFTPIPRFSEVKASVDLRLNWERPLKGRRYWTEPMPPPPGYADVGFGTPPPPKGPQVPNPGPEYYEALIRAKKGERSATGITASSASTTASTPPQSSATAKPETSRKPSTGFPVVAVAIAVVAIAGVIVFLIRRRR